MATQHQVDFYRKQRQDAESKAKSGDADAADTASKINAKLGKSKEASGYKRLGQLSREGSAINKAKGVAKDVAIGAGTVAAGGLFPEAGLGLRALAGRGLNAAKGLLSRSGVKAAAAAPAAAKAAAQDTAGKVGRVAKAAEGAVEKAAKGSVKKVAPKVKKVAAKAENALSKLKGQAQSGKRQLQFKEAKEGGRKDSYVRSKAGPVNKEAVKAAEKPAPKAKRSKPKAA